MENDIGLYAAVKQFVDAFSPENKASSFKGSVSVEYLRPGVFVFGFLIKECPVKADKGGNLS